MLSAIWRRLHRIADEHLKHAAQLLLRLKMYIINKYSWIHCILFAPASKILYWCHKRLHTKLVRHPVIPSTRIHHFLMESLKYMEASKTWPITRLLNAKQKATPLLTKSNCLCGAKNWRYRNCLFIARSHGVGISLIFIIKYRNIRLFDSISWSIVVVLEDNL